MTKMLLHCLVGSAAAGVAMAAPAVLEARAPAIALSEHTFHATRQFVEGSQGRMRPFHRKLAQMAQYLESEPVAVGSGMVRAEQNQIEYLTEVKLGNETFELIVDTGSSDTWIVKDGFQCLNRNGMPCNMGKPFKGDFPGGKIANQHLNITYGYSGGPNMIGEMGYADVTVANLTAVKQQIGLATRGVWRGDNISSGILGLGLPGLTDSFPGEPMGSTRDTAASSIQYAPLVTTMAKQFSAVFSLALHRDKLQSFISWGGVPAGVKTTGEWATTPIVKATLSAGRTEFLYYQIGVDKIEWNGTTLNGSEPKPPEFIVDSGTTLNSFPESIALRINNAFVPRAKFNNRYGQWFVQCNAKPPTLGIQIGGKMFMTDPTSMILPDVKSEDGLCATGIGLANSWPYILGDTFMQGLVTVFDTEKLEMRFAQRV